MSRGAQTVEDIALGYALPLAGPVVPAGYKHTEVGVIPEDWDLRRISDVCRLINGRGFKPFEWGSSGLPIIRIQNLNGSSEFNFYEGPYDKKIEVNPGQLLFAWSGSRGTSFGPHIWSGLKGVLNYHTWKVDVRASAIDASFFFHALKRLTHYIEERAHGASALVHTQKWEMEGFEFPLPKALDEQQAIADALSDVDALLQELHRLIAKKRDIKQAAMQQLLTGQTRLPGFDGESKTAKLRDLAVLSRLHIVPALHPNVLFTHFSLPSFDAGRSAVVETGATIGSGKFRVPDKAILLSKLNPRIPRIWAPENIPANSVASTEWLVLSPVVEVDRGFLFFVCSSPSFCEEMEVGATGTTGSHQRISPSAAMEISVRLPPTMIEQVAIASALSEIECEISLLDRRRSKVATIKHAMMQALLTGRVRML